MLTAAHCVEHVYETEIPCALDSDCPTVDEFGNPLDLSCGAVGDEDCCCRSSGSLITNNLPLIRFGERYPNSDGHPRRTIPALYCRSRVAEGDFNDFAW